MTPASVSPVQPSTVRPQDASRAPSADAGSGTEFSNLLSSSIDAQHDAGAETAKDDESKPDAPENGAIDPQTVPTPAGQPGATPTLPDAAAAFMAPDAPAADPQPTDPALLAALTVNVASNGGEDAPLADDATPKGASADASGRNGLLPLTAAGNSSTDIQGGSGTGTRAQAVESSAQSLSTDGGADREQMDGALASFETLLAEAGRTLGGGTNAADAASAGPNTQIQQAGLAHGARQPFGPTPYAGGQPTFAPELQTPIADPSWATEAGGVVRLMVQDHISHAQLRIDPPELGPIEIRMTMEGDTAAITFHAAAAATRALLENHMPRLREAMQGVGVELGQATVGQQDRPDSGASSGSRDTRNNADRQADAADTVPMPVTVASSRAGGSRLVDVFA